MHAINSRSAANIIFYIC